ncbi:MAG: EAL domain-containing protein [Rhizobiaceae bacterium]|nr:EAL domain-containing protein [Rhizobiaceae bacterium]
MSDQQRQQSLLGPIFKLHYLPAALAFVAMAAIIFFVDWQLRDSRMRDLRQHVTEDLIGIRTRLENNINGNVKLVQGYVAALETEPDMTQERYSQLGARILRGDTPIRNVAAAPDFVVSLIYPIAGNESSRGLDYTRNAAQRDAALKVRDSGQLQITGPVRLVQGGEAVIARFPVVNLLPNGREHFWGIVSAVLDLEKLYTASGLRDDDLDIDVAIQVLKNGKADRAPFFGDASILDQDPVGMTIRLGHEDWRFAAVPRGGWEPPAAHIWGPRLLLGLMGFIVVAPMIWTGRLTEERERHLEILRGHEDEMQTLSQRLQIALQASKIGIWEFDTVTGELIWDERMRDLYDLAVPDGRVGYIDWRNALHPGDLARSEAEFARAIETGLAYQTQFRVVCRDGATRHIRAIGTTYRGSRGHKKVVGVNWDVTQDVHLQEDLRRAKQVSDIQNGQLEEARLIMESAALHDALTGLPNRRYLDRIVAEYDERPASETALTVMHIDLDRFKDINDTLGHAAGDRILRHAADMLAEFVFPGDFLARIGGDEFVVISSPANMGGDYLELAGRLIEAISRPLFHEGHECRVGSSIGIATRTSADARIEQVLVNADIALYEAKRRGRNRVECFTDALRLEVVNTKRTADEILRGLEQNEFMAYFQPQFDARTLEIVGLEALARWDHPTKGILPPAAFLKIAESLKVVSQIDAVVLNQALLQQFRLNASGYPVPKVSVNVSAQRLMDEALFERLEGIAFRPGSLSFELLESISFDGDDRELVHQIERLKSLGADIEIDDFGSGHASIVTLLKLTPRRLKIDRQLVIPLLDSKAQQNLVASIIEIGRSRGIEIVAEGVETPAHVEVLRDLGCDILQGYALARPMAPGELLGFVSERRWMTGIGAVA